LFETSAKYQKKTTLQNNFSGLFSAFLRVARFQIWF
jgi:hypothetical protein